MDLKLRTLERRALAGDVEATEALLREQQRMGLLRREHHVFSFAPIAVPAAANRTLLDTMSHNFEIHYVTAVSTAPFSFSINDALGDWSNKPLHSNSLISGPYKLFIPRFLQKGASLKIELEDLSLAMNQIRMEFHGIRTLPTSNT